MLLTMRGKLLILRSPAKLEERRQGVSKDEGPSACVKP
jgi:hypothetical protein